MHIKRRSHCVCPNCLSGLNSGSGNVQQRSHSCHYPGCGKVYYTIKLLQTPMYKPHLFPHQPVPFSTWFYMVGREDKRTNNRTMFPTLKNNAAAGYQGPVKIELLKSADLLYKIRFQNQLKALWFLMGSLPPLFYHYNYTYNFMYSGKQKKNNLNLKVPSVTQILQNDLINIGLEVCNNCSASVWKKNPCPQMSPTSKVKFWLKLVLWHLVE